MENKPIISYFSSNTSLVDQLKNDIVANLPKEFIEWQRSYGRSRKVCLDAQLVPFKNINLKDISKSSFHKSSLYNRCFLHTFWFECNDVDVYKSSIREEVISWINKLREHDIWDLLVVVVDNSEKKKSHAKKLIPRSTVLDKVRADFPSMMKDAAEKCISLHNPLRNGKNDSYKFFFDRLRSLLLKSFSRHLTHYEDFVRVQREKRNSKDWDFFDFFILQEELAFAFESLSLYEDSLVQYDELDALLSQFVINSHVSEVPNWLRLIASRCNVWHGLCLSKSVSLQIREKLKKSSASLIELRNYLFFRQCEILLLQNKPWDVAARSLPFLQNCVSELKILEVKLPPGAIACWVFLSAFEILQKCERYNDSSQMQSYSRYTIGLLAYARKKLGELGLLCGLMPGMEESIHQVVSLLSGIGADPHSDQIIQSPQMRLKEALSKPEAFLKVYLEISELTISTFKHIGHIRSARLIGRELAFLYMKMNKHQQSIPFLLDLEKIFINDHWDLLLTDIRKQMLTCYCVVSDEKKILQYALLLSSSSLLSEEARIEYLKMAENASKSINEKILMKMGEIFLVEDLSIKKNRMFVTNSKIELLLTLKNNLLKPIKSTRLLVGLIFEAPRQDDVKKPLTNEKGNNECPHHKFHFPNKALDFRTYHYSNSVSVKCLDSGNHLICERNPNFANQKQLFDKDYSYYFVSDTIDLDVGRQVYKLFFEPSKCGYYTLDQIYLDWLDLVSLFSLDCDHHLCFTVISEKPSLQLKFLNGQCLNHHQPIKLLSGFAQTILLSFNSGSYSFSSNTIFNLKSSIGLKMRLDAGKNKKDKASSNNNLTDVDFTNILTIKSEVDLAPFTIWEIKVTIRGEFYNQLSHKGNEYKLLLTAENVKLAAIEQILYFVPPFMSSLKLHTCKLKKFMQVSVGGLCDEKFFLHDACLKDAQENEKRIIRDFENNKNTQMICKDQTINFLWEISNNEDEHDNYDTIKKAIFEIKYTCLDGSDGGIYRCEFSLGDYHTLYIVRSTIEPKGSEYCRVGSLCSLLIEGRRVRSIKGLSNLMYEMIFDTKIWSLTGKSSGVIDQNNGDYFKLDFEMLPLISGYLPVPSLQFFKHITETRNEMSHAKFIPFDTGQIYDCTKALQINVLPPSNLVIPNS